MGVSITSKQKDPGHRKSGSRAKNFWTGFGCLEKAGQSDRLGCCGGCLVSFPVPSFGLCKANLSIELTSSQEESNSIPQAHQHNAHNIKMASRVARSALGE